MRQNKQRTSFSKEFYKIIKEISDEFFPHTSKKIILLTVLIIGMAYYSFFPQSDPLFGAVAIFSISCSCLSVLHRFNNIYQPYQIINPQQGIINEVKVEVDEGKAKQITQLKRSDLERDNG